MISFFFRVIFSNIKFFLFGAIVMFLIIHSGDIIERGGACLRNLLDFKKPLARVENILPDLSSRTPPRSRTRRVRRQPQDAAQTNNGFVSSLFVEPKGKQDDFANNFYIGGDR